MYEEYKSVLADDTLTDAEKRERTAKLDQALDEKTEEVRSLVARADEEAEQRNAMAKFGALFKSSAAEDPEDQAEDMRSILVAVANGERRDVLVLPEVRAPGGNVSPNAGKVSDPAWAGNTTAVQFIAQVLESMRERSPFLSLVDTFSTSNGEVVRYPVKNLRPLPADVAAAMPEGEKYTFAKGGFTTVDLGAKKYGVASQLSVELMQDSEVDIVGIVANDIGEAVADRVTLDMLAKMQTRVPVGKKTVQPTGLGAITFDQLVDVEHNLRTGYRRNAAWVMGDKQLAEVRKIKDTTGQPIWQPSVTLGRPDSLLGYQVITDATIVNKAGTSNTDVAWFGDFSWFKVRQVRGLTVSRSDEYAWDSDMISWKVTWRGDGDLMDLEAVTALRTAAS